MKPLSPKLYDPLKFLAQIFLPALGTLYFTLAGVWGLPAAEQVVGTIVAVDAFLGVLLSISASSYQGDGVIEIRENPAGGKQMHLGLMTNPESFENKDKVLFKVSNQLKK